MRAVDTGQVEDHAGAAVAPIDFDGFFTEQRPRLFAALCLTTGDRQEAEELTQDAFVRVLAAWGRATIEDPTAYLYRTAMNGFRTGKFQILVATDIAARGLDVTQISHVINYDMPENTDAYIHRIGRTGRVDKTGDAFTFVTSADASKIRVLEQLLETPIERMKLEGFNYNKPAPEDMRQHTQQPQRHAVKNSRSPNM